MHWTFTEYGSSGFPAFGYRFTTVSAVSSGRRIRSNGVLSSYVSRGGVSRPCAVLQAHSQLRQPMQTVVSTSTPIRPGARMLRGPACASAGVSPVTATPMAVLVLRNERRFVVFIGNLACDRSTSSEERTYQGYDVTRDATIADPLTWRRVFPALAAYGASRPIVHLAAPSRE